MVSRQIPRRRTGFSAGRRHRFSADRPYQFNDYSRYDFNLFSEEDKRRYRDEHFATDLEHAYELGQRLVALAKKEK